MRGIGFAIKPVDSVYYATLSENLLITGEENMSGIANQFSNHYHGATPYHYFELWLNAFFSLVTNQKHLVSLYLLTYPFLNFISVAGLFAVCETVSKISWKLLFIPLFLFISALYFDSERTNHNYVSNFIESPMEYYGEKFSSYYPFLILSFLFFLGGYFSAGAVFVLTLPIVSISTSPGIILGILLFLFLSFVFRKSDKSYKRIFIYVLSIASFLFLFYSLFGNRNIPTLPKPNLFHFTDIEKFDLHSLKIFIAELLYRVHLSPPIFLLLYSPFVLLIIILSSTKNQNSFFFKRSTLLISCIYFSGLLFSGTFYKIVHTPQFYTNIIILFHVFFSVSLIILLFSPSEFRKGKVFQNILFVFVILLFCIKLIYCIFVYSVHEEKNNPYSEKYLTELSQIKLPENSNRSGAFLKGKGDYHNLGSKSLGADLGFYLSFMPQFQTTIDISVFEIDSWHPLPQLAEMEKSSVENSIFYLYVQKQKDKNKFVSIEQSQQDFINEFNIKYILVSPHAEMPEFLNKIIKIVIEDEKSKQKFILLK